MCYETGQIYLLPTAFIVPAAGFLLDDRICSSAESRTERALSDLEETARDRVYAERVDLNTCMQAMKG